MNLEKKLFTEKRGTRNFILSSLAAILLSCCQSPLSHEKVKPITPPNPIQPPATSSEEYDYTTITRKVVSQTIESLVGGSIEVNNLSSYLQGTKLIIPGGALSSNTEISVGEVDNPPELPRGLNYVGSAINLEPDGLNFNKNINIKIPYTDELLSDAGISDDLNLKLYSYNKSTKVWEQINNVLINPDDNFITAEINHFSYYTIAGIISLSPSDLGTPLPGDLLYTRGAIGGSPLFYWSWMPGHVGICVGEKVFNGIPYNVIHAIGSGVTRSYFNPISEFSGENIFMGAREPKSGALTSQQRETIVNYVESQVGKDYALAQTIGSAFGTLPGYLVKGPQKFNCVGLAEKAYEIAGVNNGEGLVSEKNEEKLLTPVEQYNSTKPASGIISDSPTPTTNTIPFADFFINPSSGKSNIDFCFDASISHDDETPLANLLFRWDWNDVNDDTYNTNYSLERIIYHKFSPGRYTIRLQVKDEDGLTNYVVKGLTVSPP